MLRTETVADGTLGLLKKLMQDEKLAEFFLVRGTGLSLQIGHRISIDNYLFSLSSFDENQLLSYLEAKYGFKLDYLQKNTIKGEIAGVKTDFITHSYPLVNQLLKLNGIRFASLEDVAAMKFNAIIGNGTRLKDFIDIAFLSTHLSLKTMINAYEDKYASRNPLLTIKALTYYNDINFNEPVNIIAGRYKWESIEKRVSEMNKFPDRIFEKAPV
jgi:hypothetical protein